MISDVLIALGDLVPVLFWVGVALCGVLALVLQRTGRRRVLLVLAGLGLVAVLGLTFWPTPGPPGIRCAVQFSVPFQGLDTLANVALLLPSTLFAAVALRRPVVVAAAAVGLSAVIELTQALLPVVGRACDTNDWFMNSVGAVLAGLLAALVLVLGKRPARP